MNLCRIDIWNGWRWAPRQWWKYLLLPLGWGSTKGWVEFSFFGFTFFWMRRR